MADPAIDEKRVRFTCKVDRIATFGNPSGRAVPFENIDRQAENRIEEKANA